MGARYARGAAADSVHWTEIRRARRRYLTRQMTLSAAVQSAATRSFAQSQDRGHPHLDKQPAIAWTAGLTGEGTTPAHQMACAMCLWFRLHLQRMGIHPALIQPVLLL